MDAGKIRWGMVVLRAFLFSLAYSLWLIFMYGFLALALSAFATSVTSGYPPASKLLDSISIDLVVSPIAWIPVACFIVSASFVAFILRSERRSLYAVIEIVVGVISVFVATYRVLVGSDLYTAVLSIFAGMYVIIRGLDNLEKSKTTDIFKRFFDRYILILKTGP